MLNPVVAILKNDKTGRWHPIVYREAPIPGDVGPRRWKSKMHHTAGFDDREGALDDAVALCGRLAPMAVGPVHHSLEDDLQWTGEEAIPAEVAFFDLSTFTRHEEKPDA